MKSLKNFSIWQVICLAARNGFTEGRSRAREEDEYARQLRADELCRLRADRSRRSGR